MTTMTISLPDSLKKFVDQEVASKGYGNVSEYVRGLIRAAQEEESEARLERLLLEALATGQEQAVTPEFWSELRQDARKILVTRTRKPAAAQSHEEFDS